MLHCQLYNMLTFTSTVKSVYLHCCVLAESCLTCSFLVLSDDNEPLLISQLCVHEHLAPSVPLLEASAPSTDSLHLSNIADLKEDKEKYMESIPNPQKPITLCFKATRVTRHRSANGCPSLGDASGIIGTQM